MAGFRVTDAHLRAASGAAWAALGAWEAHPWDERAQRACELALYSYELLLPGARNPTADQADELDLLVASWTFLYGSTVDGHPTPVDTP